MEEFWKQTEYENYEISNLGNLRNKTTKSLRKWSMANGYYKCVLSLGARGKIATVYAHRLVAKAFIPNPNNLPQVNHKDGNKLNNCVENLEWVTNQENQIHARDNGLTISGEKHKWAKLTQKQINFIKENQNISCTELGRMFRVHRTTISKIKHQHSWNKL